MISNFLIQNTIFLFFHFANFSASHLVVVGQSSGSRLAVVRQSSGSRQAVVEQSSGICQADVKQSSDSCQAVIRQSSGSHQTVIRQSVNNHQVCFCTVKNKNALSKIFHHILQQYYSLQKRYNTNPTSMNHQVLAHRKRYRQWLLNYRMPFQKCLTQKLQLELTPEYNRWSTS